MRIYQTRKRTIVYEDETTGEITSLDTDNLQVLGATISKWGYKPYPPTEDEVAIIGDETNIEKFIRLDPSKYIAFGLWFFGYADACKVTIKNITHTNVTKLVELFYGYFEGYEVDLTEALEDYSNNILDMNFLIEDLEGAVRERGEI